MPVGVALTPWGVLQHLGGGLKYQRSVLKYFMNGIPYFHYRKVFHNTLTGNSNT